MIGNQNSRAVVEQTIRQEAELEGEESKMFRVSLGASGVDGVRTEYIRGLVRILQLQAEMVRMVNIVSRRILRLEVAKGRFMDGVKEEIKLVGVREESPANRVRRRQMIGRGRP